MQEFLAVQDPAPLPEPSPAQDPSPVQEPPPVPEFNPVHEPDPVHDPAPWSALDTYEELWKKINSSIPNHKSQSKITESVMKAITTTISKIFDIFKL